MTTANRRSMAKVEADRARVELEEQARLDECEILEFLRVAKEFPEFFPPAPDQVQKEIILSPRVADIYYG
jgi:hypothetical protein